MKKESHNRDQAIAAAYASGGYTMQEIGAHFGLHYSRVSRIVRDSELKAKRKTFPQNVSVLEIIKPTFRMLRS